MAVTGPDPKLAKLGHSPASTEWTDVPNVPYAGESPDLPKLPRRQKWDPDVETWWKLVRAMPHCALWQPTDWAFAIQTAKYKQQEARDLADGELKTTLATEIRRREDQMGYTMEARRKLRIRYVDPKEAEKRQLQAPTPAGAGPAATNVVPIGDRRARMTG